jgi:hypothetical protein
MTVTVQQLSFTGGEWSRSLYARTDLAKYTSAVRTMKNFTINPHGGASNRGGTQFIVEVKDSTKFTRLIPFQFSVEQSYILEFGDLYVRIIRDGGQIESGGSPVEITTPYVEADLPKVKFIQSADVLYLTHPSYAPRKISRTSHTVWTINTISFGSSVSTPTSLAASVGVVTDPDYKVSAIDSSGRESVASTSVYATDGAILTWTAVSGAAYYNVYKDESDSGVFGWVGRSNYGSFKIPAVGITPDFTLTPPEATVKFNTTDDYPGVCTFFEQRLCFARTNNQPQTIWGSVVGDFENMNTSAFVMDSDSYEFTINARQVNEIRSLVPISVLILGTSGSEWKMEAGGSSDSVTPLSVDMKPQSDYGMSDIRPLTIGNSILFVEGSGAVIRDLLYNYEIDGYAGSSLVVYSKHLFEGYTIVDWCYQQEPDSIVWCVRDDGKLLGLTYFREYEIFAWHQHETDGFIESISSISTDAGVDEVYLVVRRTLPSGDVRYIERFMPRLPYNENFERDVRDSYFVDCGLTYDGAAATTISGLDHLEGKEVAVLADGSVVNGLTVTSGEIVLPNEASKVHVGLPYVSEIETLDFIAKGDGGTTQDIISDVKSVIVSLADTRALWFGPSEDRIVEVAFREGEDYGTPTELFNGRKEMFLEAGDVRESRAFVRNVDPLPLTILGMLPRLEYGEV